MRSLVRFQLAPPAKFSALLPRVRTPRRRTLRAMRTFRRGLLVGLLAVLVGVVVRLRGKTDVVPRTQGGWRELEGPDFR